jgi:DNA-binding IclR family transcriptional regulator
MNLADQLAKQPKTAEELAQATGAAAPSLHRLMRTLASLGLFTEDSEHRFSLTRLGEALQTGTPGSARASVLTLAGEIFTEALDNLVGFTFLQLLVMLPLVLFLLWAFAYTLEYHPPIMP